MLPSLMPGNFICSFYTSGFKANGLHATLQMIMRLFANLILLIYGLSIAGYVLLDGVHEVLHQFKNNIHHHEHDHHHPHSHHHVEDHHVVSELDEDHNTNLVIYYFHLFFQRVVKQMLLKTVDCQGELPALTGYESLVFPPLTPPPMLSLKESVQLLC